ncbi:MAG: hypothetical protein EOP04_19010 [Proteobacteria bacterium]|nr:MAG: hypothetical protein EOP04_19010 [Pseudomonadota bacterium]
MSKAADAFAKLTRTTEAIILTVPDIKIIKPEDFPISLSQYDGAELALKTNLHGDLAGVTLLLFFEEQINWIMEHCLSERDLLSPEVDSLRMSLLLEISNILTGALSTQLSNILGLDVIGLPPESIVPEPGESIEEFLCDVPPCQPIVLSVRTDLKDRQSGIEFPMLVVLEIESLSKILNIIRQRGIYNYELLKN